MSADKYHHPAYVLLAQKLGISLLSDDAGRLVEFVQQVAKQAAEDAVTAMQPAILMAIEQGVQRGAIAGAAAEREACAQLCVDETMGCEQLALNLAAAIRARGRE